MMRKPEGSSGASSGNISSIGAKTSSEQAPTAFSSTPLQSCRRANVSISIHFAEGSKITVSYNHQDTEVPVRDECPLIQKHLPDQADDLQVELLQASGMQKNRKRDYSFTVYYI